MPALPERADDARVAHVNDVFRQVAAANAGDDDVRRRAPPTTAPTRRWPPTSACAGTASTSTGTGAALVYESITDALLAL